MIIKCRETGTSSEGGSPMAFSRKSGIVTHGICSRVCFSVCARLTDIVS